jgi:hypothetical protein
MDLSSFSQVTDRPFSGDSPSSDRPIDTSSSANHLWHQEYIPSDIPSDYKDIPCASLKTETKNKNHLYF